MFDKEKVKNELFKDHVATLKDLGPVKILDFAKPECCEFKIRFLFDEENYNLFISGDLGYLTAHNATNMTLNGFSAFINNPGYFEEKVTSHSKNLHFYDEDLAKTELMEHFEENNIDPKKYNCESLDELADEILWDFDRDTGISTEGYKKMRKIDDYLADNYIYYSGKESSGILETYLLAFELARKQLIGEK